MKQDKIQLIKEQIPNLNNLPNSKLIEFMDILSIEFDSKKSQIIDLTLQLDNVELVYNSVLKEYQNRNSK